MARADLLTADIPWYRTVSKEQWRAFFATFLGWVIDAFDYNMLAFVLIDIQKSFTVDKTLAGALATVTLVMRLAGGVIAGSAADKWGRKLPMMISILWFSLFAFLSGFSTSYAMLFAFRALFGIGMGGEWTSGMPLLLEHWPARLRGIASGLLLGGWYWGYLLAATAFHFLYPLFQSVPDVGWRAMFWLAILPAFLTLWIRTGVKESPRVAGASAPSSGGSERREPYCGTQDFSGTDLPAGSLLDHNPYNGADRRVHVLVLLHQPELVPYFPSGSWTIDSAFHDRIQRWGHCRNGDMGPAFGDKTRTPRSRDDYGAGWCGRSSAVPSCQHSGSVNDRSAGDGKPSAAASGVWLRPMCPNGIPRPQRASGQAFAITRLLRSAP